MAKPDLILLHGALGAKSQFKPWIFPLLEKFEVHLLDFEGHGWQPFSDRPFAIAHFAENLRDFLEAKQINEANVFGYSMGGYVALYLAAREPERFRKIFTFATKFHWSPESAAKESKMLDVATIQAKVPHFAEMLAQRHHGNEWKEHLSRTAQMMQELGQKPALEIDDFAKIKTQVRIGIGDRDNMVSLEETIEVYRKLENAELFILPKTAHPLEKINVAKICEEIGSFFLDLA